MNILRWIPVALSACLTLVLFAAAIDRGETSGFAERSERAHRTPNGVTVGSYEGSLEAAQDLALETVKTAISANVDGFHVTQAALGYTGSPTHAMVNFEASTGPWEGTYALFILRKESGTGKYGWVVEHVMTQTFAV